MLCWRLDTSVDQDDEPGQEVGVEVLDQPLDVLEDVWTLSTGLQVSGLSRGAPGGGLARSR